MKTRYANLILSLDFTCRNQLQQTLHVCRLWQVCVSSNLLCLPTTQFTGPSVATNMILFQTFFYQTFLSLNPVPIPEYYESTHQIINSRSSFQT